MAAIERFSRKRQAILTYMRSDKTHPTADRIYAQLKEAYPDLSLATVYRNLTQLKGAGLIRSMGTVDGQERFDADITPHAHVICADCGAITDLPPLALPEAWEETVRRVTGDGIREIRLIGHCRACTEKA